MLFLGRSLTLHESERARRVWQAAIDVGQLVAHLLAVLQLLAKQQDLLNATPGYCAFGRIGVSNCCNDISFPYCDVVRASKK